MLAKSIQGALPVIVSAISAAVELATAIREAQARKNVTVPTTHPKEENGVIDIDAIRETNSGGGTRW